MKVETKVIPDLQKQGTGTRGGAYNFEKLLIARFLMEIRGMSTEMDLTRERDPALGIYEEEKRHSGAHQAQ